MKLEKITFVFAVLFVFGTFAFFATTNDSSAKKSNADIATAQTGNPLTNGKTLVFSDDFGPR